MIYLNRSFIFSHVWRLKLILNKIWHCQSLITLMNLYTTLYVSIAAKNVLHDTNILILSLFYGVYFTTSLLLSCFLLLIYTNLFIFFHNVTIYDDILFFLKMFMYFECCHSPYDLLTDFEVVIHFMKPHYNIVLHATYVSFFIMLY